MTVLLMLPYPMCCENGKPYGVCRSCWEFSEAIMQQWSEEFTPDPYPFTHLENKPYLKQWWLLQEDFAGETSTTEVHN